MKNTNVWGTLWLGMICVWVEKVRHCAALMRVWAFEDHERLGDVVLLKRFGNVAGELILGMTEALGAASRV